MSFSRSYFIYIMDKDETQRNMIERERESEREKIERKRERVKGRR